VVERRSLPPHSIGEVAIMLRPALHVARIRRSVRLATLPVLLGAGVIAAGCESASTVNESSPDAVKCQVSLTTPPAMDAVGGASKFSVTAQPECAWDVTTSANWISGFSPASGQGSRDVDFRIAPNDNDAARDGEIVVNNGSTRVAQRAGCRYDAAPPSQNVGVNGGGASVTVTATSDCPWTATTDVNWITLSPPLSGTGSATVNFTVAPGSNERTGTILIAGRRATVTQTGNPACTVAIAPTSQNVAVAGGSGTVAVTTQGGCRWTAMSNAPWLTLATGDSGTGNGSVTFNVAANTGATRSGTLTIGGNAFTVSQEAAGAPACTFSIAPSNQDAPATGITGTITVTAGSGCAWTAASNAPWISVTSGATGNGNGVVGYSIAANSGAQRAGTLTVAGQTFTVTQAAVAASCTYSISPTTFNFDASSAAGFVNLTTTAGCTWTATSSAPFVAIRPSSATGSGSATVAFDIFSNVGAQRTGTLAIAGQTVTVTQAAPIPPCTFSLSPSSATAPHTASTGTFDVIVSPRQDCAWTAGNISQPWLTFPFPTPTTGRGNTTLTYNVAANPGPQRTGTLIVSGQTFTLTQAAGPCTYTISPTGVNLPATASSATLTVTTADGCAWTAMTTWPFIMITSGASGSGSGVVAFSVTANGNVARAGTILVAEQNITVTQAAATLAPAVLTTR